MNINFTQSQLNEFIQNSVNLEKLIELPSVLESPIERVTLLVDRSGDDNPEWFPVGIPQVFLGKSTTLGLPYEGRKDIFTTNVTELVILNLLKWLYVSTFCSDIKIEEWTGNFLGTFTSSELITLLQASDYLNLEMTSYITKEISRRINEMLASLPADFDERLEEYLKPLGLSMKNQTPEYYAATRDFVKTLIPS